MESKEQLNELNEQQLLLKNDIEQALKEIELKLKEVNEKMAKHNLIVELQADFKTLNPKNEN